MILQIILIFASSFMQGINLVIYSSAATLLASPNHHAITPHEYGALFLPMIIASAGISYFGGYFEEKKGHRTILITALFFNCLSVLTFASTSFLFPFHIADYICLLIALFFLGLGFGFMLTILTPYTLALFPKNPHASSVAIYGVLCVGASIQPVFFNSCAKAGLWWCNPLLVGIVFLLLILSALFLLPNQKDEIDLFPTEKKTEDTKPLPYLFWFFLGNILLYGITSTIYSNWAMLFLNHELKCSNEVASLALSLYWGMMMVGRAVIVGGSRYLPPKITFIAMPILMTISFLFIPFIHSTTAYILLFGFAGFSFSATFPFTYSYAGQTFPERRTFVSGRLTTAYMLGYGIAAYGVGFLYNLLGISLEKIFFYSWTLSLLMLAFTIVLMRNRRVLASH